MLMTNISWYGQAQWSTNRTGSPQPRERYPAAAKINGITEGSNDVLDLELLGKGALC